MKILILTGIFPPNIGGPATQLNALAKELVKNGHQVRILTFGDNNGNRYACPVSRVSNCWPGPLKSFFYLTKGLILGLIVDVIYNQDLYTAGITSLIIKKAWGKKIVTRFVGDSAWEKASVRRLIDDDIMIFQEKEYSEEIERWKRNRKKILDNSDKIIVVSHFLKDLALKIGLPQEKIKIIYNSIDFLEHKPYKSKKELKKEFGLEGNILLTNARLVPWKGVNTLIKIMPKLIQKYGAIKLIIIGDGPEKDNLEHLSRRLELDNNVFFAGQTERQQVVAYLKIADLFVLNTNYEGMSHCLLEAMKIGVPIITTWAGGNPETIDNGETGLLVDYNNREQLFKAIASVLDNPELAKKLTSQAQKGLGKFSWGNLVKETLDIFESLNKD